MVKKTQNNLVTKKDLKKLEGKLIGRMDEFGSRMDEFGSRMDEFGSRMDKFEGRMDKFEGRMDEFGSRMDKFDKDLKTTEKILRAEIQITAEETKKEMKEEMSKNTSKILNTMDKFLKEVADSQEERIVAGHQITRNTRRIEKLEEGMRQVKQQVFA